ncbi:MAG TPA: hypothetical protein DCX06_03165 [Opitutae bacterium]|nr:hypothetical protein [Opitutae bacterium]
MSDLLKPFLFAASFVAISSQTQAAFDSGSDESDGALVIAGNQGNVVFDPDAFNPVLDADRDGVYHFTTISVGAGTTLRFRADVMGHKPMIWLASGDVIIDGQLDLSQTFDGNIPGAGGFYGGIKNGVADGQGPGGSAADTDPAFADESHVNSYLIPLIGGSGRGADTDAFSNADGVSGGGAMLLASSGEIQLNGLVYGFSDFDKSGNLRLVANTISGSNSVSGWNVLRIEAFHHNYTFSIDANQVIKTRPGVLLPTNPIKITLVDSVSVDNTKPGANKGVADVTINDGNAVTVQVDCVGIPPGTPIRVVGWNDTVGKVEATTTGLVGTVEASSATCTMVIPTGNTTFMAQAVLAP